MSALAEAAMVVAYDVGTPRLMDAMHITDPAVRARYEQLIEHPVFESSQPNLAAAGPHAGGAS